MYHALLLYNIHVEFVLGNVVENVPIITITPNSPSTRGQTARICKSFDMQENLFLFHVFQ